MRASADRFIDRCAAVALTVTVPAVLLGSVQTVSVWLLTDASSGGSVGQSVVTARLASAAVLAVAVIGAVGALGVRRRAEWGRRLLLGAIGVVMLWCVGVMTILRPSLDEMTRGRGGAYEPEGAVLWAGGIAMAVVVTVLLAWVAKRLGSREVRAEFSRP